MALLIAHAAATWLMVGMIWTVQLVHYPLLSSVGSGSFAAYEQRHRSAMGRMLALPASAEVVLAAMVAVARPAGIEAALALASGVLLAAIWVVTAVVQAPAHARLSGGWDASVHDRLVRSNWWRTGAWTARGVLAALMLT
jgi:hypothetical protein